MKKKTISIVLLATILMQSCVVYRKSPTSLDYAVNTGRVKVKSKSGQKFIFKNIIVRDSIYYGVKGKKEETLYEAQILGVYLHDTETSKMKSNNLEKWGAGIVILALLGGIIFVVLLINVLEDS